MRSEPRRSPERRPPARRRALKPIPARRGASDGAAGSVSAASAASRETPRLSPSEGPTAQPEARPRPLPCAYARRGSASAPRSGSASRQPVIALYSSARRIRPAVATGRPSSVKAAAPASASSPISVSCAPSWPIVIAAVRSDRDPGLLLGAGTPGRRTSVSRRPARCSARGDRGVTPCGRRLGTGDDRFLVLATRRTKVDVRVDEPRGEQEPRTVDHTMAVDVEPLAERRDRAAVDPDVEHLVDALCRVEHARAAHHEVIAAAAADQDRGPASVEPAHATPTAVSTATGPVVSRS